MTTRMMLPRFTFDVRESERFQKVLGGERVADMAMEYSDHVPEPDADAYRYSPLDEFVDDDHLEDLIAILVDDCAPEDPLRSMYDVDAIRQAFRDAELWAIERCLIPSDDDIAHELGDVIEALKGTEMNGIITDVYWCGVLSMYPWGEITYDEEAVTSAVLDKARVRGSHFTLTYAGTPYARKLLAIARHDEDGPDPSFGGNSEMELGTVARYVIAETVERLGRMVDRRLANGHDVKRDDIRTLLRDALQEAA